MDGVIFDTERLAVNVWKNEGDKFGYRITDEFLSNIRGIDARLIKSIFEEKLGKDIDYYTFKSAVDNSMEDYVNKNGAPIKKGLIELLEYIKIRKLKTAIATSTDRERAIFYLNNANVADFFTSIICGDMVERGKPEPDIYLKAAEELGVNPNECIVIEDSPRGVIAAHRAGCFVVIVPDLDEVNNKMREAAFYVAEDLLQVKKMLDSKF